MGLFSRKKKIYVSSVCYNLAGDERDRINYLKTTIISKIVADLNPTYSLGESITNSYLRGPGVKLRNFVSWAKRSGYNDVLTYGSPTIYTGDSIDLDELANQISPSGGIVVKTADIDFADYSLWAEQYMFINHPDLINTDWAADYDDDINLITIYFADTTSVSFTPADYDIKGVYLFVTYSASSGEVAGVIELGDTIILSGSDLYPDTDGWDVLSESEFNQPIQLSKLTTVTVSYSDGRPNEESSTVDSRDEYYTKIENRYSNTEYQGSTQIGNTVEFTNLVTYQTNKQDANVVNLDPVTTTVTETIEDGVIKTTTTVVTDQQLDIVRSYRNDTQVNILNSYGASTLFIYKQGSGNDVLDAMFSSTASIGEFFPIIPVRLDNNFLSDSYLPDLYVASQKAYKKATGAKYNKIVDTIADNASLGDIDYAYVVFGVSLNVKEVSCRKYVYKFFESMLHNFSGGLAQFEQFNSDMRAAIASQEIWLTWFRAQDNENDPLYGTKEPELIPFPVMPTKTVHTATAGHVNYNVAISWSAIYEETLTGVASPDHKKNDIWFEITQSLNYDFALSPSGDEGAKINMMVDRMSMYWQTEDDEYKVMHVYGLNYRNAIYGGKSVDINASQALADGEESGFIIPIQKEIYAAMSIKDSTQMATACSFMVFNCYQVVKQKWYQTSLFRVVVIVIAIVVAYFTGGAGAGLLGSSASVGASLGLTGVAAVIAGTIINAIAAMLLIKIITAASTSLLGDKIGSVVGNIVGVLAVVIGTSLANGGNIAAGVASLSNPENIAQLTMAVGNGYAGYMNAATQETVKAIQATMDSYKQEAESIAEQYRNVIGYSNNVIDPLDVTKATELLYESSMSFLSRTLMTGTDIAQMSQSMISDFTSLTTSTDLNIG